MAETGRAASPHRRRPSPLPRTSGRTRGTASPPPTAGPPPPPAAITPSGGPRRPGRPPRGAPGRGRLRPPEHAPVRARARRRDQRGRPHPCDGAHGLPPSFHTRPGGGGARAAPLGSSSPRSRAARTRNGGPLLMPFRSDGGPRVCDRDTPAEPMYRNSRPRSQCAWVDAATGANRGDIAQDGDVDRGGGAGRRVRRGGKYRRLRPRASGWAARRRSARTGPCSSSRCRPISRVDTPGRRRRQ